MATPRSISYFIPSGGTLYAGMQRPPPPTPSPDLNLRFPPRSKGEPNAVFVGGGRRFVILGANGAGKTRLGVWLETNNAGAVTHRISAQKALSFPEYTPLASREQAQKNLIYGRSDAHTDSGGKAHSRWGAEPATHLLSDYDKLLTLLFAEAAEVSALHTEQTRIQRTYIPVPDTAIDRILSVWTDLLPHRTLRLHDGRVMVNSGLPNEYKGKEMSDGERVALYLLGQCLCAPEHSVVIVDEPELHLHKSLMDKLWNKIEEKCPNKTLIYITHDLDFAASRIDATKLWLKSYDGSDWSWSEIPSDDSLPEALVLEIIGSRKPILFCEGERGGLDHSIYQLIYPQMHVIPRGGCEKVIEATKALRANLEFHTMEARGIVDLDVLSDSECAALQHAGIVVLPVAEVENLLCLDSIVRFIAIKLSLDPTDVAKAAFDFIQNALQQELEVQVAIRAERRIRYQLSTYTKASADADGLRVGVARLFAELKVEELIEEARETMSDGLSDWQRLLRVYNRKSLAARLSSCFGLTHGKYPELVLRTMKTPEGRPIIDALRSQLPAL
jgi:hypothetical protein